MTLLTRPVKCTPEQYLERERAAEYKNEWVDGEMRPMSPGGMVHGLITGNLLVDIAAPAQERGYWLFVSMTRIKVPATGAYLYPDVLVVCGEVQVEDEKDDTLLNPTLIIEVLAPSTEAIDRGTKFAHCRRLPSLQEYVLIAQDRVWVERFSRQGESWVLTEANALEETMPLESIGWELPLSAVYRRVEFAQEKEEEQSSEL